MKQIYLTLILFLALTPHLLTAQTNFLLIEDSTTKWLQLTTCIDPGFGCLNETQYSFAVTGTTTANNHQYYMIQEEYWLVSQPWPLGSINPTCTENSSATIPFSFGIREDSGKVYYLNSNVLTEHLIYDFTAQVGDSVPDPTRYDAGMKYEVLSMDSILIDGAYRKRWQVDGAGAEIIEGIGSTFGLVNTIGMILECGFSLTCYSEGDSALYPNPGPACETSIGHLSIDEETITVMEVQYTESSVNILTDNQGQNMDYFLYDNAGRLVNSGKITRQITFNNEEYTSGIYFVQIANGSVVQSQRIMIR